MGLRVGQAVVARTAADGELAAAKLRGQTTRRQRFVLLLLLLLMLGLLLVLPLLRQLLLLGLLGAEIGAAGATMGGGQGVSRRQGIQRSQAALLAAASAAVAKGHGQAATAHGGRPARGQQKRSRVSTAWSPSARLPASAGCEAATGATATFEVVFRCI